MNRFSALFFIGFLLAGVVFLPGCQAGMITDDESGSLVSYSTKREVIGSEPGRPYSSAVKISRVCTRDGKADTIGETLYVSGQVGVDPGTGEKVSGDIKAETRQVLTNLKNVVDSAGFSLSDAVRCTVYLVDMDDYAAMNEVYLEFFPASPPSRACVGVSKLAQDFQLEISLVAER